MSRNSPQSRDYVRVGSDPPSPFLEPFEISHSDNQSIAKKTTKQYFKLLEFLAVMIIWFCFTIAVMAISPRFAFAWKLGYKRQLQVLGVMLSIMGLCFKNLYPKLLIVAESRSSASTLQNCIALWQQSSLVAHTDVLVRTLITMFTILPIVLGLAYKEYLGGSADHDMNSNGDYYGLAAPAGLSRTSILKFGPTYMTNATLPFLLEFDRNDSAIHYAPYGYFDTEVGVDLNQVYGTNVIMLSNKSTAFLDTPMPDYMHFLQEQLDETSSFRLSAPVHGTVTIYDNSIDTDRNDQGFWEQIYGPLNLTGNPDLIRERVYVGDMQGGKNLALLNADYHRDQYNEEINNSWSIISFVQQFTDQSDDNFTAGFESNAMLFNTKRCNCNGTWLITFNSIRLTHGDCNISSVPDQAIFVDIQPAFKMYYASNLIEFLAPLGTRPEDKSAVYNPDIPALIPIFTTVVAGMYWSRFTALMGFDNPDMFNTTTQKIRNEIHYHLQDSLISIKQTLRPDLGLYLVLAIFPICATFVLCANMVLSFFSHVDGGNFGIIALLAGVQQDSLKILEGASFSGALRKPVHMQIRPMKSVSNGAGREIPQNQYILFVDNRRSNSDRAIWNCLSWCRRNRH